jgi:hypothetical protein
MMRTMLLRTRVRSRCRASCRRFVGGVFLRNFQSAIESFVDEVRVLQLSDDLRPNNLIEKMVDCRKLHL